MSLAQNITMLTRPHPHTRPDGRIVTRAAFLDQLAKAIHTRGRDGAAASEPGIPINTRAIDLWRELDTDARNEEHERAGTMRGTLGSILERWADEQRDAHAAHLEHVTLDMIDRIQNLLDPAPKRRKLRQPCPACGQDWVLNGDGDREPCLTAGTHDEDGTMRHPAAYDITCASCGAEWHGNQLTDVLAGLDAAPERETTTV